MRTRPPLLVSAGIIHHRGQVLIGQRRKNDRHSLKWEFPGGKVEHGETPQEALVRELWEELRIRARVGGELARYEHDYPNGSRVHLLFFSVPAFNGEPSACVFEQIRWVNLEALPTLDFVEGDLDFIRRLSRGEYNLRFSS
ncbi:MAG: (deoxy)nucleoside triphosphate pyrophosphohydrolase [Acidobacteriota bacterium]|nr:(deoxy)nucleoside triphosphate pyrophosphohydrolase [Acidobacteriota bacterium]